MKELISRALGKLFSGRYFTTVAVILTICIAYLKCLDLVAVGKINIDVFLGLSNAFFGMAGAVITFYFTRTDRLGEPNKEVK